MIESREKECTEAGVDLSGAAGHVTINFNDHLIKPILIKIDSLI